ncbi:hypothetical protein GBA63_15350 [Rubrobacter tropicus]|uniref:Uncharacterized protein n=1 Tax=Rubrobacter tropicus TaxID=2653851 RepID=A0A6G8QBK9_9ACTN|nr:hypothetical protein [Rubrobacter tropicus]QIN83859.1 hypothetical protein GBA63_15350 [Rubrobacter tropicus]
MEDLGRIRFVTENYERLQGLRRLPLALCVTAFGLLVQLDKDLLAMAMAVVVIYPAFFAESIVGRLYERRFGRVRSRVRPTDYVFWAALVALVFAMDSVQMWLDGSLVLAVGGIVGAAYVLGAFWPREKRHGSTAYWPIIAALAVATGLLSAFGAVAPGLFIIGLGLSVSVGLLLDHLLLVRTFKRAPKEEADAGAV